METSEPSLLVYLIVGLIAFLSGRFFGAGGRLATRASDDHQTAPENVSQRPAETTDEKTVRDPGLSI